MITSQCCPYCQQADETELHILWECTEWATARDPHLANVHALAVKVPQLPPFDRWPPRLKMSGLLPEIEPPVNRQVEQHNLPFIRALHVMFVSVLAARKLRDQQTPKLFPTVRPQTHSAYPYHQLAPCRPPPGAPCLPAQPQSAHLAMGKALLGTPTGLAARTAVDGWHRHNVLH